MLITLKTRGLRGTRYLKRVTGYRVLYSLATGTTLATGRYPAAVPSALSSSLFRVIVGTLGGRKSLYTMEAADESGAAVATDAAAAPATAVAFAPPTCVDREYATYVFAGDDDALPQYVYQHRNGLCVVGVGPGHPILERIVLSVDFKVGPGGSDRSQVKVSGKKKSGAVLLRPADELCIVRCSDGTQFTLRACVTGRLIEVNQRLLQDPAALLCPAAAANSGYVCILQQKREQIANACADLKYVSGVRNP